MKKQRPEFNYFEEVHIVTPNMNTLPSMCYSLVENARWSIRSHSKRNVKTVIRSYVETAAMVSLETALADLIRGHDPGCDCWHHQALNGVKNVTRTT